MEVVVDHLVQIVVLHNDEGTDDVRHTVPSADCEQGQDVRLTHQTFHLNSYSPHVHSVVSAST